MSRHRSPSPSPSLRRRSLSHFPQKEGGSSNSGPQHHGLSLPAPSSSKKDVLKTSLVFLGAIGAASLATSKFWPKGILYGEKESWACEAKGQLKHAVGGNRSDDPRERRHRSFDHGDRDAKHRRRAVIRDEAVVTRPDGRTVYVDNGWDRRSYDEGSRRSSDRSFDTRGRASNSSPSDVYGPRGARGR